MGEIEHAGTAKAMPAIQPDVVIKTSDDAGQVVGEIVSEPTAKTAIQPGADTVAAERGMPPIPRPDKP